MVCNLISTRDVSEREISYSDALLEGLAPDGGLYIPKEYPRISLDELKAMRGAPYNDIAFRVKDKFTDGSIPSAELHTLLNRAYTQEKWGYIGRNIVPLIVLVGGLAIENLSQGPTAAFKDMALQPLAQEMNYELERRNKSLVILGATSGDTGSSAEAAFKGLSRIKVFMLSPKTGMSDFQRAQMGILSGGNVYNISVDGRFDDCQDLVKLLKKDPEFAKLGAVNSINWGRISSQIPYYVSGYLQAARNIGDEVDFTVSSGNFGNVLAGHIAKQMGVPIRRLVVATNENNVLDRLMKTGIYQMTPAQVTSSPSMDISKASNYERLAFDILGRNPKALAKYMQIFERTGKVDLGDFGLNSEVFALNGFRSGSSNHQKRLEEIRRVYSESDVIIDPHTADGVSVARQFVERSVPMVVMATALPVKFEDTIREALGFVPKRENRFEGLESRLPAGAFHEIGIDAEALKSYIRANIR